MRLADILREKPHRLVWLPPTATAPEAAALMKDEAVGAVLVCDEAGRALGLVSERELALALVADGAAVFRRRLSELMSVGGPTATPGDSLQAVMRVMTERRARHVPIVEDGVVVGVVSIGDVLKSRLAEKVQEIAVLQDLARSAWLAA
jgi:CBS domain-containing protein